MKSLKIRTTDKNILRNRKKGQGQRTPRPIFYEQRTPRPIFASEKNISDQDVNYFQANKKYRSGG